MLKADLRLAWRSLRKSPGFTTVAVMTIALGLGANTAIFSFLDGVLLKPLPYPEPERLVQVWEKPPNADRNVVSALNYLDWRAQATSFTAMAAVTSKTATLSGGGEPRQLRIAQVGAAYFEVLGRRPALGRTFVEGEDQRGRDHVLVLGSRVWRTQFGGDPGIVGKEVVLDGEPHTVIGVLPGDSEFDRRWADLWMPLSFPPDAKRDFHYLTVLARLKPDRTLEQARAEMATIASRIALQFPDIKKGWSATTDRWVDRVVGAQLRLSLQVLMTAVGAVLLIGCANLANLLLARGTLRAREMSLRAALGASRWQLVRQLLTESLLLAAAGGVAGLALGYAMFRAILGQLPPFYLPPQATVGFDARVALFLFGLTLATGLLFGLAPALSASRRDPVDALREGGRGAVGSRARLRLRNALVVAEVGLAFLLVSGAGLLIRSYDRLTRVDAGFEAENVVTMSFPLVMGKDTDGARLDRYVAEAVEAVRAVPGVREAAFTTALPLQGWGFGMPFWVDGQNVERSKRPACYFKIVTPGYFSALGMRIRKGRALSEGDAAGAQPVVVVNEAFAKKHLGEGDPLGRSVFIEQIVAGKHELGPDVPWQVVGVVADEKVSSLDDTSVGVYVSYAQNPIVGISLLARGIGEPGGLIGSIQRALWGVNKNQALPDAKTLLQIKDESLGPTRLRTLLLAVFAGLALLLAAIGVYGVLAYVTAQRTQEMGVRAALGASSWDLVRLVVGGGSLPILLGLAVGVAGTLGLTRLAKTLLFETSPTDVATMLASGALLLLVALLACYLPARGASGVDPMVALRSE